MKFATTYFIKFSFLLFFLGNTLTAQQWRQIGQDISDTNSLFFGVPFAINGNGDIIASVEETSLIKDSIIIKTYRFDGKSWVQFGDGIGPFHKTLIANHSPNNNSNWIALSGDGKTIVFDLFDEINPFQTKLQIYKYNSQRDRWFDNWRSPAFSVNQTKLKYELGFKLNNDGSVLFIQFHNYLNRINSGINPDKSFIRVYELNVSNNHWSKRGMDIVDLIDQNGDTLTIGNMGDLSNDGKTLLLITDKFCNHPRNPCSNELRLYKYQSGNWTLSYQLNTSSPYKLITKAELSGDGKTFIVEESLKNTYDFALWASRLRVFKQDSNSYELKDILINKALNFKGNSISNDGSKLLLWDLKDANPPLSDYSFNLDYYRYRNGKYSKYADSLSEGNFKSFPRWTNYPSTNLYDFIESSLSGSGKVVLINTFRKELNSIQLLSQVFTLCITSHDTISVFACEQYTWDFNSITYDSSGMYVDTVLNSYLCDSIISLDLTILKASDTTSIKDTACDTFFWALANQRYSNSGLYYSTLSNVNNCDSVLELDLTITNSISIDKPISACNFYHWKLTDSTYTTSGSYSKTLKRKNGCDSIVQLKLTIHSLNDSLVYENRVLSSLEYNASYQWLNCEDNYSPIVNEKNRQFVPVTRGKYAVEIKKNGCVDTSNCIPIDYVRNVNCDLGDAVVVYPNPNNGLFTVDLCDSYEHLNARLFDSRGKLVIKQEFWDKKQLDFEVQLAKGYYYLELKSNDKEIDRIKVLID